MLTSQEDTLRNELQGKTENTYWTDEIEAERLTAKYNQNINTDSREFITPQMLSSIKELQPVVYPQIKDFASLDCSSMNTSLFSHMDQFCKELCKGTDNLSSFFNSKHFFNYVFFKNDFEEIAKEIKGKDKLFDRYLICKGFENQDLAQVPVRFYNNKDYVDLSVYLTYDNGYRITQIEVIRWGKTYGESEKDQSN